MVYLFGYLDVISQKRKYSKMLSYYDYILSKGRLVAQKLVIKN